MKAAVVHPGGKIKYETVDDPTIKQSTDAIIRVTATAICGSDLHVYNASLPQARPMVMGHEFMGIVEETGSDVKNLKRGDRVIVPFPIACGGCFFCNDQSPASCANSNPDFYGPEGALLTEKGGGIFGYTDLYGGHDGGQAEYVRVPYADYGPRIVPESLTNEQALFLTDIFPTGYTGVDWCEVKGGETVLIFGAGPVGIMAAKSAWIRGAERVVIVDTVQYRLDKAKQTANAEGILWEERDGENVVDYIRSITNNRGADVCIEAVGFEPDRGLIDRAKSVIHFQKGTSKVLKACMSAVRRNGIISVMGVYIGTYDNFPVGQFFDKGLTIRGGQAPVHKHIDLLMKFVEDGKVTLDDIITHRLPLSEVEHAYDIFRNKEEDCVKVVLTP